MNQASKIVVVTILAALVLFGVIAVGLALG